MISVAAVTVTTQPGTRVRHAAPAATTTAATGFLTFFSPNLAIAPPHFASALSVLTLSIPARHLAWQVSFLELALRFQNARGVQPTENRLNSPLDCNCNLQ